MVGEVKGLLHAAADRGDEAVAGQTEVSEQVGAAGMSSYGARDALIDAATALRGIKAQLEQAEGTQAGVNEGLEDASGMVGAAAEGTGHAGLHSAAGLLGSEATEGVNLHAAVGGAGARIQEWIDYLEGAAGMLVDEVAPYLGELSVQGQEAAGRQGSVVGTVRSYANLA